MTPESLVQRSKEWYEFRAGKCTASRICDVLAMTKNGPGAARAKYFRQLVAERITGKPINKPVRSLDRRVELEPDARAAYEFYYGNSIVEVGFIPHPSISNAGCSPDGLIGNEGMLEVKALDSDTHLELIESNIIDKGYAEQIQFQMACSGRQWVDFAAFNPDMPEEHRLYVQRVSRDEHAIGRIEGAVKDFLAEVDERVRKLTKDQG